MPTQLERLQKLVKFWTKQNEQRQQAAKASQKEFEHWTAELAKVEKVANEAMANFNDDHSTLAEAGDYEQIKSDEKVSC